MIGIVARDVETVGIGVATFVAICGCDHQQQARALGNANATHFDLACSRALEAPDRPFKPEHFVDGPRRQTVARPLVLLVIIGNAAWTVASFALLFSGAVQPNGLGEIMVVAQAVATGVLAELQYIGLRRSQGALAV